MMDIKIREMKKSDIMDVQQVAKVSWHDTYDGIIPRDIQDRFLHMAYSDEMMNMRFKQSIIMIAEVDHKVIGFVNFSPLNQGGVTELSAIYLCPNVQGKGIGTLLLKAGIHRLQHVKEIYVNVEKDNKIGINFYRAKGFTVTSEFDDDFDGHVLRTVRMVLKLT